MNGISPTPHKRILIFGLENVRRRDLYLPTVLAKKQIETVFYCHNRNNISAESRQLGAKIILMPRSRISQIVVFFRLLWMLLPDLIIVYGTGVVPDLCVFLSFCFRIPVAIELMGGEVVYWNRNTAWWKRLRLALKCKLASLVMTTEHYVPEITQKNNLVNQKKIVFYPCAVPISGKHSPKRNVPIVLYLNLFKTWRHPDLIVRCARRVLTVVPDAQFLLVGRIHDKLVESKRDQEIERLVSELGLESSVHILPFTHDAGPYFDQASVFVLPASLETQVGVIGVYANYALLEAMERCVPAIVSDIPKANEIVEHGVNGLLAPLQEDAWVQAIIKLLTNDPLREQMGWAAHETIRRKFNIEDRGEYISQQFRNMLWK